MIVYRPIDALKARKKLNQMIVWINLNYLIGNSFGIIMYVILRIQNKGGRSSKYFPIFTLIYNTLMWSTLGFNILIYYYFNKKFRLILKKFLKRIIFSKVF